jgi:hypothetical protein
MAIGRISKTNVDALRCPPQKDRYIVWDDKLKGFGIQGDRISEQG